MGPTLQLNLHLLYNDARLGNLLDTLDELHTAASEGSLRQITTVSDAELVGWLYEVMYTAQEIMSEIDSHHEAREPELALVPKSEAS
jgi:hypothetical protein